MGFYFLYLLPGVCMIFYIIRYVLLSLLSSVHIFTIFSTHLYHRSSFPSSSIHHYSQVTTMVSKPTPNHSPIPNHPYLQSLSCSPYTALSVPYRPHHHCSYLEASLFLPSLSILSLVSSLSSIYPTSSLSSIYPTMFHHKRPSPFIFSPLSLLYNHYKSLSLHYQCSATITIIFPPHYHCSTNIIIHFLLTIKSTTITSHFPLTIIALQSSPFTFPTQLLLYNHHHSFPPHYPCSTTNTNHFPLTITAPQHHHHHLPLPFTTPFHKTLWVNILRDVLA